MVLPATVFRWGLWGPSAESVAMLSHSVGTFRHYFPGGARFVVYTDDVDEVERHLAVEAEVLPLDVPDAEYLDRRATWMKWAPHFRHDPEATEFRVDADIFLVDEPVEISEFITGDGHDYMVTMEEFTELWPYGSFATRLGEAFTPINAGLFGQRAGFDLSADMRAAYEWWNATVDGDGKYHDEQGALAFVLQTHIRAGAVRLLDPARYRVVCPLNDPPVESLDGLVGLHATYPEHPAFYRFLDDIRRVSGVARRLPPNE